eukprot:TRINITY_DN17894_c0_g2_i2.p1 TRINITY_DN17894_c0_g2~~TRINITY_DN17894_c0_g2_i2.p1  ORF type:complete len:467 (+),score=92.82 TRINITY_DN17894_c0_g2_i2:85-1401(+)
MPVLRQKDRRAILTELIPCCFGGARGPARCGAPSDDNLGASLMDGAAGSAPGAGQPAHFRRKGTWFRRVRDKLGRVQLPAWTKGKTTQAGPKLQPVLQRQQSSTYLVPEQPLLMTAQSSSFQPEMKLDTIDSQAEANAKLQRDLATQQTTLQVAADAFVKLQYEVAILQAKLRQSARDEAAARQRALRAELRDMSHEEQHARDGVQKDMDSEWEAIVLAFNTPRTDNADEAETTLEPSDALAARECVPRPGIGSAELTFPETRPRSPTHARDCLFIDVICHWVGSFVHRDWARVCSTTASAVYRALIERHHVWFTTAHLIGVFQSVGAAQPLDVMHFGPEPGPLCVARRAALALAREVGTTDTPNLRVRDQFMIHVQIIANMYQDLRLHHMQAFATASCIATDMDNVLIMLEETLEMRRARVVAAGANAAHLPASAAH